MRAGDAARRVHRQHLLGARPDDRWSAAGGLHRVEGCSDRAHSRPRPAVDRPQGHPGQCNRPRLLRIGDDRAVRARLPRPDDAAGRRGTNGRCARTRSDPGVAGLGGGWLRHGPDDRRRRWREHHVTELSYHVVDVFTDRSYAGNPLAVVLDADGLTGAQMQSMAREFNLSETTFVLPPTSADAAYRARIFTPAVELPFAGHPSIGTAWLLKSIGRFDTGPVVQECGAGLLPIVVSDDGAELTGGAVYESEPLDTAVFAAAVGASDADLIGTPTRWCGCGIEFGYVHVDDAFLVRAVPDLPRLAELGRAGVCVFSFDGSSAHSRVFAGGAGVAEDPATGSAALGLGVF